MKKVETKNNQKSVSGFWYKIILNLVKASNIIAVTFPFALCWYLYYADRIDSPFYRRGNIAVILLFALIYFFMVNIYDGLTVSLYPVSELIYSQCLGMLVTDGLIYIVICILSKKFAGLLPGLACIGCQFILIVVWAVVVHRVYFSTIKAQCSAVIYEMREGIDSLIDKYGLIRKFEVKEVLQVSDCLADLSRLNVYHSVFLSGIHSHERNLILKYCIENDISVYVIPRIGDVIMSGSEQMHLLHLPMLRVGRYCPDPMYLFIKRALDLIFSLAALILTSPVFLATAIAVRSDGGPVFYKQERLTKDGKVFRVLKFRSMCVDAEKDGVARLSRGEKDDRITKVGRFIRRVRIDELPQLLNILKGDMSLVGPRPERPAIAEAYERELPEFRLRLQAKAGLTGYAQVYGKYNTTPYDKLVMDLIYISHPSLLEDFRIFMATVKILFMPESTEGVAEDQTTALKTEEKH